MILGAKLFPLLWILPKITIPGLSVSILELMNATTLLMVNIELNILPYYMYFPLFPAEYRSFLAAGCLLYISLGDLQLAS